MSDAQENGVPSLTIRQLAGQIGQVVGTSDWMEVDQARIDAFAEVTEDRQYIHVDPVRAKEGPFGTTIAHGFLTLSLLAPLSMDALPQLSDQETSVNYGFDKIRFIAPVPSGARIRGIFTLQSADWRSEQDVMLRYAATIEIEGVDKPALAADWLVLLRSSGA